VEHNSQLAALFFAVGIVALLWVFRRTLLRTRQPGDNRDALAYRSRHLAAGIEIDEISAREWLATWRNALKFQRGAAELTARQQGHLAALTAWQLSHLRNRQ
jgi:hypothetical protein